MSDQDVLLAAAELVCRQAKPRKRYPQGHMDERQRWFPNPSEVAACCKALPSPGSKYTWSLRAHCCTAAHVANLRGVSVEALRLHADVLRGELALLSKDPSTYLNELSRMLDTTQKGSAMSDELITIGEAARLVNRSVFTIRRWMDKGKLTSTGKNTTGRHLFRPIDVQNALAPTRQ